MQIGYKASSEQFGPRRLVDLAVRAEDYGLDIVCVSDHFLPWRHDGGHAPHALTVLTAMGERTSRVRLGTSVLTPTFRYNPAVIAQTAATMALLAPDRVFLGVGTGEALNEIAVSGRTWPDYKERIGRLGEAIEITRRLMCEGEVDHAGTYYTLQGASIYDRPSTPMPIYVAAGGPSSARFAGRVGDGMIVTSGKGMALYTDELLPALADGATKAGRSSNDLHRMIEIKLSYDRDPERARTGTRFWAPLSLSAEQKHTVSSAVEMERLADQLPPEQINRRWIVASSPEDAMAGISPYIDAGFDELVFHAPAEDQERFLDQFNADVLPLLRSYRL